MKKHISLIVVLSAVIINYAADCRYKQSANDVSERENIFARVQTMIYQRSSVEITPDQLFALTAPQLEMLIKHICLRTNALQKLDCKKNASEIARLNGLEKILQLEQHSKWLYKKEKKDCD